MNRNIIINYQPLNVVSSKRICVVCGKNATYEYKSGFIVSDACDKSECRKIASEMVDNSLLRISLQGGF